MKIKKSLRGVCDKLSTELGALRMRQKDDEQSDFHRLARERLLFWDRNLQRPKTINTAVFCTGI
jgi:hypothetical protein